ncbi:cell division protein FtsB [Alkalibacillus filiformis]|uniref:Cell division protein FtsB n=1 Tax=Alkalibacillus filiformis TaxID=200990 RepID=A0ABU0DV32_9BACI|nr:hypothetical protein [Alkalibacillus filiformis]MDQ0352000.1 cell division protein FtsB [Alkalibacillus filiformis]
MSKMLKRIIFIWIVLVILIGGIFYLFNIHSLKQSENQLENDLSFEERKQSALLETVDQIDHDGMAMEELRAKIPEHLEEDNVIRMINNASSSTNSVIQTYNYDDQQTIPINELFEQSSFTEEVDVLTMQINGYTQSEEQLVRFISELENGDRLLQVTQLQYSQNNDDEVNFQLSFSVFAYSM